KKHLKQILLEFSSWKFTSGPGMEDSSKARQAFKTFVHQLISSLNLSISSSPMNTIGKLHRASVSEEVLDLDSSFFPNPWNEEQWKALDPSQNILLEWRSEEKLLGFALFGVAPADE